MDSFQCTHVKVMPEVVLVAVQCYEVWNYLPIGVNSLCSYSLHIHAKTYANICSYRSPVTETFGKTSLLKVGAEYFYGNLPPST